MSKRIGEEKIRLPRVMLAAPASGSGKTLLTCGLVQALIDRGRKVAAFKCGPDYIDPLFLSQVTGAAARNLDTFFTDRATARYLFGRTARQAELSVLEGVMGYYDGLAGLHTQASSYDVADATRTPVIFIVNTKGMSLSVLPMLKGFLEYRSPSHIRAVILNQTSASVYEELKQKIERELPLRVLGYVPRMPAGMLESRHLGLVTPKEIKDITARLRQVADRLAQTVDLDGILALAKEAAPLDVQRPAELDAALQEMRAAPDARPVRIGIARDKAFCFYYEDNLSLLRELGAQLIPFSPLADHALPAGLDGLIFGGGYPELYAEELSKNTGMLDAVRTAVRGGMPYLAECGGFMYLQETMEDMSGASWPMAGVIPGHVRQTERSVRFGYIELTAQKDQIFGAAGEKIRGHEFHYFDSSANGNSFLAKKPGRERSWECIAADGRCAAGFPHLYYYSNPQFAARFVRACRSND